MRFSRPLLLLAASLFLGPLARAEVHKYDLLNEIPEVTIIGPETPEYVEIAKTMRAQLLEQIAYWQERGLPDPPDLNGIYIFSDPKDLTILDILKVLNPGRVDATSRLNLFEHMTQQREALLKSGFFEAANQLRKERFSEKYSREDLINFIFDYYCLFRYGFAVSNTYDAIVERKTFSETKPFMLAPIKDNAFYGKFPRVDLSEILKPADKTSKDKTSPWEMFSHIDGEALVKKLRGSASRSIFSRRIVILPRTSEGEQAGDLQNISSLSDPTLPTHELGHHINSSLAEDHGSLNRMFEEIFADYSTAAPFGNPVIGQHFARASGLIAERLGRRTDLTLEQAKYRAAFAKIGRKGYLRSFSDASTLDTIDRHFVISNSYDGGDPGRFFLENLRRRLSEQEQLDLDAITIDTIRDVGHLPKVISTMNSFKIVFRNAWRAWTRYVATEAEKKKMFASPSPEVKELIDQATWDVQSDPEELAKVAAIIKKDPSKAETELVKRLRRQAAKLVTPGGFSIQTTAENKITDAYKAKENKRRGEGGFLWELARRPPVEADYVLPELFRAYYRSASAKAPHLVDRMLEEIEIVTDMKPVPLRMDDGTTEIALVRRTFSHNWLLARSAVRGYLNTMHELRPRIAALKDVEDRDSVKAQLEPLEKQYDVALEHLQQFERTNSALRMVFSSPLAQVGRAIIKRKAKLDKDQQKVLDLCAAHLAAL